MCRIAKQNGSWYPWPMDAQAWGREDLERFVRFIRENAPGWYRHLPWREDITPYRVLVSEFMLQQTNVGRVIGKYGPFLERFPDIHALAAASLGEVLGLWQGLGYNKRAVNLWMAARDIVSHHGGRVPDTPETLMALPGIGAATAGAVTAFAYNKPAVFLETNIRRVFLHVFFSERSGVKDREILPLVEATLDRENPRSWYYALMDCGAALRRQKPNPNRKSSSYTPQPSFEGSDRQVRGKIIRALLATGSLSEPDLLSMTGVDAKRMSRILAGLEKDGLIARQGASCRLP